MTQNNPMMKCAVSLLIAVAIFSGIIRFSVAFEFVLFLAIIKLWVYFISLSLPGIYFSG